MDIEEDDEFSYDSDSFEIRLNVSSCLATGSTEQQENAEPAAAASSGRIKTPKRLQKYRKDWVQMFNWIAPVAEDCNKAMCRVCNVKINISYGGASDIKKHEIGSKHKNALKTDSRFNAITNYFPRKNSKDENKVIAAELTSAFHAVKHNQSYASLDCSNKLMHHMFKDSETCQKISCGRTKAEAMITDVLAPKSVEKIISDLRVGHDEELFYSIGTDASNKKNRKMFPLVITYFSREDGIQSRLLNFFELNDESAIAITASLNQSLTEHNLNVKKVSAYAADNANVNYGCNHSVYTLLKDQNENIIKANCLAHVIHNTIHHAVDQLDVDIENIVTKLYGHFSVSAKRREALKGFFDFVELEFHDLLMHCPTRWLSLRPAVERLLQSWPALLSYFKSIEDCPVVIQRLLRLSDDDDEGSQVVEIYLSFCHNVSIIFEEAVKTIESDSITCTEAYDVMDTLLEKIKGRKRDSFFGSSANSLLQKLNPSLKMAVIKNLMAFFDKAIQYMNKWFDFSEDNIFFHIKPFSLHKNSEELSYSTLVNAVDVLKLGNQIDKDKLYDEFCVVRPVLKDIQDRTGTDVSSKWVEVFSKCCSEFQSLKNLYTIVSFILSIPPSNAPVERVFSVMLSKWSDTRNRCLTDLIKSELMVYFNLKHVTCTEFYSMALKDKALLKAAKSNTKYKFKK